MQKRKEVNKLLRKMPRDKLIKLKRKTFTDHEFQEMLKNEGVFNAFCSGFSSSETGGVPTVTIPVFTDGSTALSIPANMPNQTDTYFYMISSIPDLQLDFSADFTRHIFIYGLEACMNADYDSVYPFSPALTSSARYNLFFGFFITNTKFSSTWYTNTNLVDLAVTANEVQVPSSIKPLIEGTIVGDGSVGYMNAEKTNFLYDYTTGMTTRAYMSPLLRAATTNPYVGTSANFAWNSGGLSSTLTPSGFTITIVYTASTRNLQFRWSSQNYGGNPTLESNTTMSLPVAWTSSAKYVTFLTKNKRIPNIKTTVTNTNIRYTPGFLRYQHSNNLAFLGGSLNGVLLNYESPESSNPPTAFKPRFDYKALSSGSNYTYYVAYTGGAIAYRRVFSFPYTLGSSSIFAFMIHNQTGLVLPATGDVLESTTGNQPFASTADVGTTGTYYILKHYGAGTITHTFNNPNNHVLTPTVYSELPVNLESGFEIAVIQLWNNLTTLTTSKTRIYYISPSGTSTILVEIVSAPTFHFTGSMVGICAAGWGHLQGSNYRENLTYIEYCDSKFVDLSSSAYNTY